MKWFMERESKKCYHRLTLEDDLQWHTQSKYPVVRVVKSAKGPYYLVGTFRYYNDNDSVDVTRITIDEYHPTLNAAKKAAEKLIYKARIKYG